MSVRGDIVYRRTYSRQKEDGSFEVWEETIDRVIRHQEWLWSRAKKVPLRSDDRRELQELRTLMVEKKILTSGRTLWLGGTPTSMDRESSMFNCSFTNVETVYDLVDVQWLLLQGCGVGFRPIIGTLNGFFKHIPEIEVIRSTKELGKNGEFERGCEFNIENFWDGIWKISIGDSAEAWAKAIGKLVAGKYNAHKLILDFSEIRPAGVRLKGYGWISSGDEAISKAYTSIANILNKKAGQLLSRMDILDIVNFMGSILSSRRSAEIALFDYGQPECEELIVAKKDYWVKNPHRGQSNNSIVFRSKPTRLELERVFKQMEFAGGSEPGIINAETALKRAPWFQGVNPCAEILLGNKSFCNLVEIDLAKFRNDSGGLLRAIEIAARANYRQTLVDLRDGILQEAWHLDNEFLRLCGVGLTGITRRDDLTEYDFQQFQRVATTAAYSMADELELQRPKNVTTIKPSGTLSKVMDTTEGIHKPLGKYIFNNITFGIHDPLVPRLKEAGYYVRQNPTDAQSVLVTFPVAWRDVAFTCLPNGQEINLESAIQQLERYRMIQTNYVQHNTSITVSYSPNEVPEIIEWILNHWDIYIGVSFLYRADPTKTPEDLGYPYLPQEVVTEEKYLSYVSKLRPLELEGTDTYGELDSEDCVGGACPVK